MTRDCDGQPRNPRRLLERGWTPEPGERVSGTLLAIESDADAPTRPTPGTSAAGGRSGDPMDDLLPHGG